MFNMRNFTFGEWLNEFIEVYKKPFLKSCVMPELIVRLHVPDEIKSVKLDELTLFEVERAINGVKASRTRLMTRNVCHQALKKAYSLHLIRTDIAAELAPVPHTYKQGEALTTAEQREFLEKLKGNPLEGLLMFCLLTGAAFGSGGNVEVGRRPREEHDSHSRDKNQDQQPHDTDSSAAPALYNSGNGRRREASFPLHGGPFDAGIQGFMSESSSSRPSAHIRDSVSRIGDIDENRAEVAGAFAFGDDGGDIYARSGPVYVFGSDEVQA